MATISSKQKSYQTSTPFQLWGNCSLRTKLILAFLTVVLSSIGAVIFLANHATGAALTANEAGNLKRLADSKALSIGELMTRQFHALRVLSLNRGFRDRLVLANTSYGTNPQNIQARLDELDREWTASREDTNFLIRNRLRNTIAGELALFQKIFPDHTRLLLTDMHGGILATTSSPTDYNQAHEEWWQAAFNNGQGATYVGPPTFDEPSHTLIIAIPLYDNESETVLGVLQSIYRFNTLANIVASVETEQPGVRANVLFPTGQLLASDGLILEAVDPLMGARPEATAAKPYEEVIVEDGPPWVSQTAVKTAVNDPVIADLGWKVMIRQNRQQVRTLVAWQNRNTIVLAILIGGLAIGLAFAIGQPITGPITRLSRVAVQVSQDDLTAPVPGNSRDEVGLLAALFSDETKKALGQTKDQATRLATLNEISEELSRAPEINDILSIIAEKIDRIIESDRTSVTLLDKTGNTLEVFTLEAELGVIPAATKLALDESGVGLAIQKNIIINTPDTNQMNPCHPYEDPWTHQGLRSTLVVPLVTGDQVIGTLNLGSRKSNAFTARDEELIRQVASLVASTIENKRLFEAIQMSNIELEIRTRELEASQQVTFAASEHTNPDELLNLVVNLIRDQFDLYHAQVYLVDQREQMAVLEKSTGYAGRQLLKQQHRIPLDSPSLVARAIRQGQSILVADVKEEKNWSTNELLPHTQAQLVVPLKVGGQAVGALDVQSRTTNQLTPRTATLFQTMTDQVGFLFEHSELLSHVSEQTASLTRFSSQLRTAAEVTERLNTILDPDVLLEEVVTMVQNRFALYHTQIYLLDTHREKLMLKAGSGELGQIMRERGHRIPLNREQSLVARAARTQEIVMVKDFRREAGFIPNPLLPETRSAVAIPLVASSGLLGVLDMQDSRPERFEQTDLDTFSTLAGQIATALENARLFEETQQTAQHLRQIDRMKSEFLANMSHELRTPLNSIIGYSEMLLMGISGELPEEITGDIRAIYDNGKHLLHVISDILDLAKIEAGRLNLQLETVTVGRLLDEIKVNNAGLFMNRSIELIIETEAELPEFQADPIRINQIFNNLISNAVKFTPKGHVIVRAFRDSNWITFEIEDTGVGISEEALNEVFEKFMQVDGSFTRRAEGTGLGLAITRHLIHLHKGEITLRSQLDVGTTFTVRLPLESPQPAEDNMLYDMITTSPTRGHKHNLYETMT